MSKWLVHSLENLAEDADDDFLVVSYIMKIMFYTRLPLLYPNETTMVMNCDAEAMNVGYSYYVKQCQTQFYIQTVT